jgi:hypothetical protein
MRRIYTIGILLPLVALGVVAALGGGERELAAGLGPGGTAHWLYPRSSIRDLVTYGGMAVWLLWELRRRTPAEFMRLLWRAPLVYTVASFLLPLPFVLVNGVVRELFSEYGGRIALRLLVRLAIGFGYVALLGFIREKFQDDMVETGVEGDSR